MMERAPQPVREMLALLRESGHTPYLVGGWVRDLLRGAEPDDYDMTSDARPEEVMALFGADAHPTGLMHGTVTLVRGGLAVEHTTERCDGAYRDSRHPESVRFTGSIEEDLARRDFTVNAIALAPDERLVDPFGGREDLRSGVLLLPDLGKPKSFTQDANGIGHFYGHTAASAKMAEEIMARLRFEHALAQGVRAQLACFDEMFPPERAAVHRMMARYGRETMWNLLQTKLADNAAKAPDGLEQAQKPWREALLLYNELLAENACCSLAELRIGGGELLAIGFSGRAVGRAKQRLLDEVASEKLANEHGALVRRAERLYRSGWRGETDGRE